MKIIELISENVKKISVVQIRPDGNLVQITGKNGQGKTSVLDSIWWALAGATHIQTAPIRDGATEARIRLNLGEILVTRTFKRDGTGGHTTKITVETADGYRAAKPQQILDDLLSSLSFDPLAFTRMKPREQFDELRQFVPDIDFDKIEADNKRDYDRRTDINRQAKLERAAAEIISVPLNLPAAEVDISDLVLRLERAGQANTERETRAARRDQAVQRIAQLRGEAVDIRAGVAEKQAAIERAAADASAAIDKQVQDLLEQVRKLQERSVEIVQDCERDVAAAAADAEERALARTRDADDLQAKLDAAAELPEAVDTAALRDAIEQARIANAAIAKRNTRAAHLMRAEELEAAAKDLTDAIETRLQAKEAAIAAATLPVEGITFGAGAILLNGLPFNQASDAEQLRASVAIAMASAPALRVIRVRDGSLLDEDGVRLLGEMADKHDCQVWIERVDSSGTVGFVLEDGHLKAEPKAKKAAPQNDLLGAAE